MLGGSLPLTQALGKLYGGKEGVTLRDGRFHKRLHDAFLKVNQSIDVDRELYREDIRGSNAYARALRKKGLLTEEELRVIIEGLGTIDEVYERIGKVLGAQSAEAEA